MYGVIVVLSEYQKKNLINFVAGKQNAWNIEKGKIADIVIIPTDTPHMTPIYSPYSQLVYAATGADVRDVIINGRIVYRDKQFTTLDSHEIFANIRRICQEIA